MQVDKDWFLLRLEENNKNIRHLADHLGIDRSAASRMLSGKRGMRTVEATQIAAFLGASVNEVLRHAGLSIEEDGRAGRVLLAATINAKGEMERLPEPRPLPQSVVDRAKAAVAGSDGRVIAAQVRAADGPLAVFDDAVALFRATDIVEPSAIGVLAICRTNEGAQFLARIDRARKTGEARVVLVSGTVKEVALSTATPILAFLP